MPGTMTPSKRARTHAITIAPEVAFNTDPAAGYKAIAQWDYDPSQLKPTGLENQQIQSDLRGTNPKGEGLLFEAQTSFSSYLEGLGVGAEAGDGIPAVPNGWSCLAQAYCGQAMREITGDTVALVTDASNITPTTPANFAVGDIIGLKNPTGGKLSLRYVTAKAGDELTLNKDLPWLPIAAEVIFGTVTNTWQEEMTCSIAVKALGKDQFQNFLQLGAVVGLELPDTTSDQPQVCSWTINQASFNKDPFAEAQIAPSAFRPVVAAGGEFFIRRTGETVWTEMTYLKATFSPNQEVQHDPAVNSDFGVSGWTRTAQAMQLGLHFKNGATVPTGSSPVTTWRQFFYDGNEAVNSFDIMLSFSGGNTGRSVMLYFQEYRVNDPVTTNVDVDSRSAEQVMFEPIESATSSPFVVGQA